MSNSKPVKIMPPGSPTFGEYGDIPIDTSHPAHNDPLVDIFEYGIEGESYYARTDGGNDPYYAPIIGATVNIYVRKSVAEKLVEVNRLLAEKGLAVFVYDGYRPITCQQGIWDHFWEEFKPEFTDDAGRMDEEALRARVLECVSDPNNFNPDDPATWPVHSTGGAVDLALMNTHTRKLLDLGSGFDDMGPAVQTAYFEKKLRDGTITPQEEVALKNRRILVEAMESVGFTNAWPEWFHFGLGDQMSALLNSDLTAYYGYAEPPPGCELIQSRDMGEAPEPPGLG